MKLLLILLIIFGVFGTVILGLEAVYIGIFASENELSEYPWGTELGWSYLNRHTYMISGLIFTLAFWLPLIILLAVKYLTNRSKVTPKNGAL